MESEQWWRVGSRGRGAGGRAQACGGTLVRILSAVRFLRTIPVLVRLTSACYLLRAVLRSLRAHTSDSESRVEEERRGEATTESSSALLRSYCTRTCSGAARRGIAGFRTVLCAIGSYLGVLTKKQQLIERGAFSNPLLFHVRLSHNSFSARPAAPDMCSRTMCEQRVQAGLAGCQCSNRSSK